MISLTIRPGLELRNVAPSDAPEVFAVVDRNRAHLREWLPWVDASRAVSDTTAFIDAMTEANAAGSGAAAAIRLHGQIVGIAGYHDISRAHRRLAVGYWLSAEHQGQGLATFTTRALVTHALRDMGLNRVELRAATGNTRSRAVAGRLGFQLEGVCRQAEWLNDHFVDHAVYSVLASEWRD